MLDRLKSFFGRLSGWSQADAPAAGDAVAVAATALMLSVIEADGQREKAEQVRLREALGEAYGLSGTALDELVAAGEAAQREAIDLSFLTGALANNLDDGVKADFIGILWQIVYADGEMHEVEDDTVWRIAELIGVSEHERVVQRRLARKECGLPEEEAEAGND